MTAYSERTHSSSVYLWLGFALGALSRVPDPGRSYLFFTVSWFTVSFPMQLDEELSFIIFLETELRGKQLVIAKKRGKQGHVREILCLHSVLC